MNPRRWHPVVYGVIAGVIAMLIILLLSLRYPGTWPSWTNAACAVFSSGSVLLGTYIVDRWICR